MSTETLHATLVARTASLQGKLLSADQLEALRAAIDEATAAQPFCDGCGFCCHAAAPILRQEFDRIHAMVLAEPSLARPQGLACAFLDPTDGGLRHNVLAHGNPQVAMEPVRCRIYAERPLACRIFPGPGEERCRAWGAARPPDLRLALEDEEAEDYPHTLLQRYYLTLRWEWFGLLLEPDPEVALVLVPGWVLDPRTATLQLHPGPHWFQRFQALPEELPAADSCELEPWAVELFAALEAPVSYRDLCARFGGHVSAEELGELLALAELDNILVPVDVARTLPARPHGYWGWLAASR